MQLTKLQLQLLLLLGLPHRSVFVAGNIAAEARNFLKSVDTWD